MGNFTNKKTDNIKDYNSTDIKLLYTSVYKDETNIENLEAILSPEQNEENAIVLLGFRKIFLNEIQNETNIHFPQNWHHSEQGILQWLLKSLEGQRFLQNISGKPKYKIFILTYRDMCLRCSTTFFLAKDQLTTALTLPTTSSTAEDDTTSTIKPVVEIISMSIERYEDHLNAEQNLVLTDQNEYQYNSVDERSIIRGVIESPSPEGRERIIKEMTMEKEIKGKKRRKKK